MRSLETAGVKCPLPRFMRGVWLFQTKEGVMPVLIWVVQTLLDIINMVV
jgi:hypothetical protein